MKTLASMAAVVAVLILGTHIAAAQSCEDVIKTRQTLMKRSGDMAKAGAAMVRGQAPFDEAKVKEILAAFADKAQRLPDLFPDCSKTGGDTHATPAVWEKPDEFKERIAKFASDVKAAQESAKDLDTFKASFATIGKDCGACHETFRTKQH